ncbi:MAG TPA: RagB/SusD family nutrient uptake outer membrane protein [Longimicrobiales bacterium]|nr:RagB/SusD family nutrient uptake outer membrane protein [Longimicrobiales bacterium]
MGQTIRFERWAGRAARVLGLGLALGTLSACDDLLEVELPHLLTDAALESAATAETQVESAVALFECGYNVLGTTALGHEDAMQSIAGVYGGGHVYDATPNTGTCGDVSTDQSWFDQVMGARAILTTAPSRLVPSATGVSRGIYDRIQDEFSLGAPGERLSAIAAIYVAASLAHMGEFLCEIALDGSEVLTPTQVLDLAEDWITNRALGHIASFGDFAMPNDIAPSAQNMAIALRARIRWANRDFAGAAADAATVLSADPDFNAWISRETGLFRRNHLYHNTREVSFSGMLGINDWWNPAIRRPNPVTGVPWPDPIPFTGYLFVGIMPDGRTLEAGNLPVRWAEEFRAFGADPTPLGNGAVPDTRVLHIKKPIQGPTPEEVPERYEAEDDDMPYMTWEELRLIQADHELQLGNFANAIAHVNALRTAHGLPTVSGTYLASLTDGTDDAAEVRALLLEERRREFFAEGGRYWSTKIQNTDVLWFPRGEGATPFQGYALQGGVRQTFATDEYETNPNWAAAGGLALRGTGCASLFGSQAPVIQ